MKNINNTFESYLELGELLLSLGRVEEAQLELRKAKELSNTITIDDEQQAKLEQLQTALERTDSVLDGTKHTNRNAAYVVSGILLLSTLIFFAAWILARANIIEMSNDQTSQVLIVEQTVTKLAQDNLAAHLVSTKSAAFIDENNRKIQLLSSSLTQAVNMVTVSAESIEQFATLAADNQALEPATQRVVETIIMVATPTPGSDLSDATSSDETAVVAEDTVTPQAPSISLDSADQQLRITEFRANFRSGPDHAYQIYRMLDQNDVVQFLGYSSDFYWYHVEDAEGQQGWVHTSLAHPTILLGDN